MTYLLTGATGFLGRNLIDLLLQANHSVHYLGRKQKNKTINSRAVFHPWPDPVQTAPSLAAVPPVDAVINLTGEPVAQRWNAEIKRKIKQSRSQSTHNLIDALAALSQKPSVLVSASAIGYYGDRKDEVLTEANPPGQDFLADVCKAWEHEADRAQEFGLRLVKVRIGIVLGAHGGALQKMLPTFRWGVGGKLGSGKQWMSWVHINDLLRMIIWAAENPSVAGVLNGTAPHPVTNEEFTRVLATALKRPALFQVPRFALRLMLGEAADSFLASTRAVPAAAEQQKFSFRFSQLEQALADVIGSR